MQEIKTDQYIYKLCYGQIFLSLFLNSKLMDLSAYTEKYFQIMFNWTKFILYNQTETCNYDPNLVTLWFPKEL